MAAAKCKAVLAAATLVCCFFCLQVATCNLQTSCFNPMGRVVNDTSPASDDS
ncbi:hypothetical protein PC129_g5702 [Phytophthora cactorum]|uniref:Uncharacterized protein n=1 Tax=Phytophthora cactorum TaxID=29920 RepID=A0A8T1IH20_9STRA|nr:hypothetical protein PC129_g5702 [Phytophthora cactorum]